MSHIPVVALDGFHGHLLPYSNPGVSTTSEVGGAANIAAMLQSQREAHGDVLLLSGGDFFQGPPISTMFDGAPVIEVMNHDRYDAMTLGNHDLDRGQEMLAERISEAKFPVLAANLLEAESGRPIGETEHPLNAVQQYMTRDIGGARVAVIGLMKPETPTLTHPKNVNGLRFEDPAVTLGRVVPEIMEREKPDCIILQHQNVARGAELTSLARELAGGVPYVAFIGGHSGGAEQPVAGNGTLFVEGTDRGTHVNNLRLDFDERTRVVRGFEYERLPVLAADIEPHPGVARMVGEWVGMLNDVVSTAAGEAPHALTRNSRADSTLGNFLTDAMAARAGADAAFLASGTLKADVQAGTVRIADCMAVLPFDNALVRVSMTGAELRRALEESVSACGGGKVLQVSGVRMTYGTDGLLSAALSDGSPIQEARIYQVAVDDFLAAGGDGYTAFLNGTASPCDTLVRDVLIDSLAEGKAATATVDGRVTRLA